MVILMAVFMCFLVVTPVHASGYGSSGERSVVVIVGPTEPTEDDTEETMYETEEASIIEEGAEAAAREAIGSTYSYQSRGERTVTVIVPSVIVTEEIPEVPLYFQADYPHVPYGRYGTVASHGCGITCVAMAFTYLLDYEILPDQLALEFGHYNTEHGSYHSLFPDSAEVYGLTGERTYDWDTVVEALEAGHIVIANPTENIFTDGGHFILLYGITEDGKILVHDPNKYNYTKGWTLMDGFENGFEQKYIKWCSPFWIYQLKDI